MADAGYLTIGKVVRRLQRQYPDLSVSKVRYLEDEGLLNPSRTPGGYRLYSSRDIQRLETILYLQKSKFLPLSVIKEELDGKKVSEEHEAEQGSSSDPFEPLPDPMSAVDAAMADQLYPIERVPEVLGIPIALVRRLSDCGIIRLRRSPAGRDLVDGHDIPLIRACAELGRFGIEPKNLRQYVTASNRESPMFEQALVSISRHQGESEKDRRHRRNLALDRMLALTNSVRSALIRRSLDDGDERAERRAR